MTVLPRADFEESVRSISSDGELVMDPFGMFFSLLLLLFMDPLEPERFVATNGRRFGKAVVPAPDNIEVLQRT